MVVAVVSAVRLVSAVVAVVSAVAVVLEGVSFPEVVIGLVPGPEQPATSSKRTTTTVAVWRIVRLSRHSEESLNCPDELSARRFVPA